MSRTGTFLAVQWLGLQASTAGGTGSIPGHGTKIPHAAQHNWKKKIEKRKKRNVQNRQISRYGKISDCLEQGEGGIGGRWGVNTKECRVSLRSDTWVALQ